MKHQLALYEISGVAGESAPVWSTRRTNMLCSKSDKEATRGPEMVAVDVVQGEPVSFYLSCRLAFFRDRHDPSSKDTKEEDSA